MNCHRLQMFDFGKALCGYDTMMVSEKRYRDFTACMLWMVIHRALVGVDTETYTGPFLNAVAERAKLLK